MEDNEYLKRISIDDAICNGRPIIRGMRITVQTVLEFILAGTPDNEILEQFPLLEAEDLEACRLFAIRILDNGFTVRGIAA
jgi:uncharacterized protein (DUF433 family)